MLKTIVSAALPVDERIIIRKNCLKSGTSPKRVCIVTGTHGDELEGQYVCSLVARTITQHLNLLDGCVEIYPCLNPLGMDSIIRGIPGFDLDMNRIFPGDPDGMPAESIAWSIIEDLKGADLVLDIHSSNIFLREVPQARINIETAERLLPYAKLLNTDFLWIHESATVLKSTLAHSLNTAGTPCVVVEMGVGMRINHSLGRQLTAGIFNLLKHFNMWQGEVTEPIRDPIVSQAGEVAFINAERSGVFLTEIRNGCEVTKDEHLGYIVSPLTGEVISDVKAPTDGFLFTIRAYPIVYEGSLIARIHHPESSKEV